MTAMPSCSVQMLMEPVVACSKVLFWLSCGGTVQGPENLRISSTQSGFEQGTSFRSRSSWRQHGPLECWFLPQHYLLLLPRRPQLESSPLWKPQILHHVTSWMWIKIYYCYSNLPSDQNYIKCHHFQ